MSHHLKLVDYTILDTDKRLAFVDTVLSLQCMRLRSDPQTLPATSMLHLNVAVYCPEFRPWGMRSSDTWVQYFKTTALMGGRCGNLDWVSPELLSPAMSVCTPTEGGETSEVPVVVVSCCVGGMVPYQCCKKDIGYFIKIMWLQVQWIRFFIWHAPFPVASKNLKLYLSFLSTRVFELS